MTNIFRTREAAVQETTRFFLATITGVTADGLTIIPDGQTEALQKKYKLLLAGQDAPGVGDRVVVMRQAGTCLILGTIGAPGNIDPKVSKSGDTMTGNLDLNSKRYTVGIRPEESKADLAVRFLDKVGTLFGAVQALFMQDGRVGARIAAHRTVNRETVTNALSLLIGEDGARSVGLSEAKPWRAALGLGTSGNFPITAAQGGTGVAIATANRVFAAPNGSDGAPAFRALVAADLPIVTVPKGGTGVSTASANQVFAGPSSGSAAAPSFRALTAADIPNLDTSKLTTGILPIARGGTQTNGVSLDNTVSNVVTEVSGYTFSAADYAQWGKIAQLHVIFGADAADSSTGWRTVGHLKSAFRRPIVTAVAQGLNAKTYGLKTDGSIVMTGPVTATGAYEVTFTYLLN